MAHTGTGRTIALATLVAGTLDICSAFTYAAIAGRGPVTVLRGVGSAILGKTDDGTMLALVGLALHFAIMAVMATVYVLAAARMPTLRARPLLGGIAYGLATWAVMNLIVLPLRWPTLFPKFDTVSLAEQLFSHIVLVGIPIALIARRASR